MTGPMKSTFNRPFSELLNHSSTSLEFEQHTKSLTHIPRWIGGLLSNGCDLKTHGSCSIDLNPKLVNIPEKVSHWCQGDLLNPHSVFFNFQCAPSLDLGHPLGGCTIAISSLGDSGWQNVFLRLPCFSICPFSTVMDTSNPLAAESMTGA